MQGEAASRGLDWLGGALAEIGRDQLREMSNAAGLPVRANSSSKWLPVSELREALLAYLAPDAEKAGSFLIASCMDKMCNWNEVMFQSI